MLLVMHSWQKLLTKYDRIAIGYAQIIFALTVSTRLNRSMDVNLVHICCAACTDWRSIQLSLLKEQQVYETSEVASAFKPLATSSCKNFPMFR